MSAVAWTLAGLGALSAVAGLGWTVWTSPNISTGGSLALTGLVLGLAGLVVAAIAELRDQV